MVLVDELKQTNDLLEKALDHPEKRKELEDCVRAAYEGQPIRRRDPIEVFRLYSTVIESFVDEVNRRATETMVTTGKVEGALHAAIESLMREIREKQ